MSDLFLTLPPAPPTMQPESSDGLASVGTILPEGRSCPVAGRLFPFYGLESRPPRVTSEFVTAPETLDTYVFPGAFKSGTVLAMSGDPEPMFFARLRLRRM